MTITDLFSQLSEAYLLIDPDTQTLILLNPAASVILKTTGEDFTKTECWKHEIIRSATSETLPEIQAVAFQNQHLTARYSEINDANQRYIAVNITPAIPSEEALHNFFNIVDHLGAYVYCKDNQYQYTYANQQVCELFEREREEVIGGTDNDFFGEETGSELQKIDSPVIEAGHTVETEELNFVPQFNEYRHYLSVKKPLINETGEITGLFGISTDITEQKRVQQQLHTSEKQLSTILDNVGAYIFIKDKARRFQYINRMTEQLFQRKSDEIVGMDNFDLLGPEQGEEFDRTDRQVFNTGKRVNCIETFATPEKTFYYWTVKIPMFNEEGEIDSYIGISTDITEQKKLEHQVRESNDQLQATIEEINILKDKLQQQATHDPLTGLFNRRFLEEHVELSFTDPSRGPTSLLMVDVDHFKRVNDALGHKAGDEVLQFLATLMREECRSNDLVCRYGGEEFIILLPNTPLETAFQKAEWIRIQYELKVATAFPKAKGSSISIGVATSPEHGNSFETVYQAADKALYMAKEQGRNRSIVA